MSRSAALLKGFSVQYLMQGLVLAANMALAPLAISRVGATDYGLWLVVQQVLTYLGLSQFGVISVLPRELGKLTARGAAGEAQSLVDCVFHMVLYFAAAGGLLAACTYLLLPDTLDRVRGPLGVVLFGFVACYVLTTFSAILSGAQDFAFQSLLVGVGALLSAGLSAGLLAAGWGVYGLAWGWLAGHATVMAASAVRTAVCHPHLFPRRLGPVLTPRAAAHLRAGGWVTVNAIAGLLIGGPDVLLVAAVWGPAALTAYGCTGRLAQAAGGQAAGGLAMALPGLTEAVAVADPARLRRLLADLAVCQLALTGSVAVVVLAVNHRFVGLWVGDAQYAGDAVTVAVAVALVVRHLNMAMLTLMFAMGYDRRLTFTNLAEGVCGVAATATCVWLVGPAGGYLGGTLVLAAGFVPLNARFLTRALGGCPELSAGLARWAGRFVPLAVVAYLSGLALRGVPVPPAQSALLLVAHSTAVGVAYAVVMYPLVRPTPVGERLAGGLSAVRRQAAGWRRPGVAGVGRVN